MGKYTRLRLLAVGGILFSTLAWADLRPSTSNQPKTLQVLPQNTFIPPGFDDNDRAQLIFSGYLPNTCFKAGSATAKVDPEAMKITVQTTVYKYSGIWCGAVVTPYLHSVDLGILAAGQYQVFVEDANSNPTYQGELNVAVSQTRAPDDFLYAPVENAWVESLSHSEPSSSLQRTLVLRGSFQSDCMHLQEIRVLNRVPNMIEVFPIATLDQGVQCHDRPIPFETQVKIESPQESGSPIKGKTLIYIRSMNGQAVAKVVDF